MIKRNNKFVNNEQGSLIMTIVVGLTLLSAISLTSSAFMQKTIQEIKKTDSTLELENSKKLIMSYFADDRVCTAHLIGKSLNNLTQLAGLKKVNPDFSLNSAPMIIINNNASDFKLKPTITPAKNEVIVHDLSYTFKSTTNPNYTQLQSISLLIEADNNSKIVNCRTNIFSEGGYDLCNPDRKGLMKFETSDKQTKVCNGNKWINASRSAGIYTFATNSSGGIGQCWHKNHFTKDCKCPSGFKPVEIHDVSTKCVWKYWWYGSGAGCDHKIIECINEEVL